MVGPDAPSGADGWSAADLAAHLKSQSGVARFGIGAVRWAMAHGVHFGTRATALTNSNAVRVYGRGEFEVAVARVRQPPPGSLTSPSIAAIELFEIWSHGDDLRRANNLGDGFEPGSLSQAVDWLVSFQRKAIKGAPLDTSQSLGDQMRWLTGRPAAQAAHVPPLSI